MKLQITYIASALVAAAVLASGATAANQPVIALQHIASPDPADSSTWGPNALTYLPSPDPRDSVASSPTALAYLASPDPQGVGPAPLIVRSSGFDWTDAGIGAAIASGLAVVIVGGALVLLRRRVPGGGRRPAPTPAS
jgi:hypothetical protein